MSRPLQEFLASERNRLLTAINDVREQIEDLQSKLKDLQIELKQIDAANNAANLVTEVSKKLKTDNDENKARASIQRNIIKILRNHGSGTVSQIVKWYLEFSGSEIQQGTLSSQLSKLRNAGKISREKTENGAEWCLLNSNGTRIAPWDLPYLGDVGKKTWASNLEGDFTNTTGS